jgi:DNA-directed RNA polymerase specialized sigma24 family protein
MLNQPYIHENKRAISVQQEESVIELYDVYTPALLAYIGKIVQDTNKAETILQAVFAEVSQYVEAFASKQQNLFILLFNMARNLAVEALINSNSPSINATNNRALGINNPSLRAFMGKLPLIEKTIMVLIYYRGFSLHEVAGILHLPLKLVESKMLTASQKLQQLLPAS